VTIEIHAPGGSVIEFPDGTDAATIQGVMSQHFGGPDKAQDKAPSMATGLTKSFGEGALIGGGLLNKGDAAFDALIAPYVNWMLPKNRQNTGKTFGERYERSLDARERREGAFEREHP
jgi:hypothetical protein